jgi:Tol biopolymer transport system component
MSAIIADEARPIVQLNARLPTPFRWIVERCLAKDPVDRYASTADLFKDLTTLQRHLGELSGEENRVAALAPSRRRGRMIGVAAAAGVAVAAATLMLAPAEPGATLRYAPLVTDAVFQGAPAWSPDGKTLAYVSTVDGIFQLFTRSVTSPTRHQLTSGRFDSTDPFWSPNTTRIYYHSLAREWDSLWSVSAAGGQPELVIENASGATIAPDGQTIAYFHEEASAPSQLGSQISVWLASPDGTNARRYQEAPFDNQTFVAGAMRFSPDESKLLAWVWGWADATSNVPSPEFWILPWPTGKPYKVLSAIARAAPAAATFDWLPDSRRIVVSLWDEATTGMHLWTADTETGARWPLTSTPGSENRPDLSPDGQQLAFTWEAIDFDIVEIPLNGTPVRNLLATSRSELDPTFSRDGSEFAYVSDQGGTLQIWFRSRDGKFESPVVGADQFPGERTLALGAPSLSPDGQRIAYQRYAEKSGYQIWVSTVPTAGPPARLTSGSFFQDAPTWSPDGQWVAFIERSKGGISVLAKARVGTGSTPEVILRDVVTLTSRPKWSPDGQWIMCDTAAGLVIVNSNGGEPRVISEDAWIANAWAADSKRVFGLREADARPRHYALAALNVETGKEEILNPDLGVIPPASQPIRGLATLGAETLVTSVASARSGIWVVQGFDPPRSALNRLWPWRSGPN